MRRQELVLRQVWAHTGLATRSQFLSLRRGLEPKTVVGFAQSLSDVNDRGGSLFFTVLRLTTNFIGSNRPFAEDDGGNDHGTEATVV